MLGLHRVCVQNAEDGPAQWEAHRVCGQVHPCQGARLWPVADGAHSSGSGSAAMSPSGDVNLRNDVQERLIGR